MQLSADIINYLKRFFVSRQGDVTVGGSIFPDSSGYNLGRSALPFDTLYVNTLIAENIASEGGSVGGSDTVDGYHAYSTPQPNALLALDASSHYPTSVYPGALLTDGSRNLTGNLAVSGGVTIDGVDISAHAADSTIHHSTGMSADDHAIYVHVSSNRTITAVHTFAPGSASVPFSLGANAQGQTVVGFRADQLNKTVTAGAGLTGGGLLTGNISLDIALQSPSGLNLTGDALALDDSVAGNGLTISSKVINVGAGAGITVDASSVALTTPGTLSYNSPNQATGNHLHAITSASNVIAGTNSILRSDNGNLYLAALGVGVASLSAVAHIYGTGPQLRLDRGGGGFADFTVDGAANLVIEVPGSIKLVPDGSVIFDPVGNDVRPENNYDLNLGLINKKFLTLHAAELWVETLVAQNTMATIGGRILVGPTTTLEQDLGYDIYTFVVKHNSLLKNDVIYMEADGKVEFMTIGSLAITVANTTQDKVTVAGDVSAYFTNGVKFTILGSTGNNGQWTVDSSSYAGGFTEIFIAEELPSSVVDGYILYTGTQTVGPYRYFNLTRNMDATGENLWYAGDAVFNTGQTGNGFIDIYSLKGVNAASTAGPTIVGNVRTGTGYNAWKEHWAVGNLKGIYGYGADTYGLAAGPYVDGEIWISADTTYGFRIMRGATTPLQLGRWDVDGTIYVGDTGAEYIQINPTSVQIKDGSLVYTSLEAGVLTLGYVTGGEYVSIDDTNGIRMWTAGVVQAQLTTGGVLTLGETAGGEYVRIASTGIEFRGGNVVRGSIGTDGTLWFGRSSTEERIAWDSTNGILIYNRSNVQKLRISTTGNIYMDGVIVIDGYIVGAASEFQMNATDILYDVTDATTVHRIKWRDGLSGADYAWMGYNKTGHIFHILSENAGTGTSTSTIWLEAQGNGVGGLFLDFEMFATNGDQANTFARLSGGQFRIAGDGATYGLVMGATSDVQLYRGGTNLIRTPDSVQVDGTLWLGSTQDTNLYRNAANQLRTDDVFIAPSYWFQEVSAPGTPSSGWMTLYGVSTGLAYWKNDGGDVIPAFRNQASLDLNSGNLGGGAAWYTATSGTLITNVIQLPATGTSYADWSFALGQGWAGKTLTIWVYHFPLNTNNGSVRLYGEMFRLRDADTSSLGSPTQTISAVDKAMNQATSGRVYRTVLTATLSTATWADGDAVILRILRAGDHANDTYTWSAHIVAIEILIS